MKSALIKDTIREIKKTKSRFLSIFAIVAIGVSFFAGVKATCPDMKLTADHYFDKYHFMDIRLISTMGFDKKDLNAVKKVEGLEGVAPSYSIDALVHVKTKDLVFKVWSLPLSKMSNNADNYINQVKLVKGRLPQKANECVVEEGKMQRNHFSLGSKIKLASGTAEDIGKRLKESEYTIVGIVATPYYLSTERGTTSIGNGKINSYMMIPEENFKLPVYTDVFLTVKDARSIMTYDSEYKKFIKPVTTDLKAVGKQRAQQKLEEIKTKAANKIADQRKKLRDAEKRQKEEFAGALSKLESAQTQITVSETKLEQKEAAIQQRLKAAAAKLDNGYEKLAKGEQEYRAESKKFTLTKSQALTKISQAEAKIRDGEQQLAAKAAELEKAKLALKNPNLSQTERQKIEATVQLGEQQLELSKAQLKGAKAEVAAKKAALKAADRKLTKVKATLTSTRKQLDREQNRLTESKREAQAEFKVARNRLAAAKSKLQKGQQEYKQGKKQADQQLAAGYAKIAEAEKKINQVNKPTWYVLDRSMHADYVGYEKAADRVAAIAQVFPVFFFLIAALVCLTTMTRMVEEQRTYIGTLKALGYSKWAIAAKYLFYALLASVSGSIFGLLIGFKVFPKVIFNAYGIIYTMPPIITEFNWNYAVLSTGFAVLATTIAAFAACYKELLDVPAELMRPKAPKAGKRIFLERLRFVWQQLNFSQKVTARNLFRYKKRFFMTVLGISGCTALLLAGFGLKDSVYSIATKQFDELYQYDMIINLKQDQPLTLKAENGISDLIQIKQQNIDVSVGKEKNSVSLFVPENAAKLKGFIIFRERTTGKPVTLTNNGVVLTEKLAKILKVNIGDTIELKEGETKQHKVKVTGITENYVSHYVYMSPKLYREVFHKNPKFQELLAKTTHTSEAFENKLSSQLLNRKEVSSVSFITGISKNFEETISSLNYVILVLIISAGALAFVVLYNLTNVNITERLREIATIKVLGFYDYEVSNYVYRENILLTIIGLVFGLVLGVFLHRYIVITSEIDNVMFGRTINGLSYFYSALLTLLFSGLVNVVMHFRLKKISMVESLKSID
ncbi:FtsX-like permease family protein [Bacillus rubiinfantis]|uniref:FtsX-like permease family protein n=1 Tax=Bacillus rubiinfantis TaxID=1499680 RepID=UPI0005A8B6F5|nr:FtsX-like permease family protein [Bacillus rubiinfantis]